MSKLLRAIGDLTVWLSSVVKDESDRAKLRELLDRIDKALDEVEK